ncbi:MAG: NACHT domain-containing protein [Solirubrobacterales bacterium]|nr:NACHT domain-containing protein [Solirubrobacterales bacterium]
MTAFDDIALDLASFADDDEEIIIDADGSCIFVRGGQETQIRLRHDDEDRLMVEVDGREMTYRRFLGHHLAGLPVLAERILAKRKGVPDYVDSQGVLASPSEISETADALTLLEQEAAHSPGFLSRVIFITADAGQGKTALLKHFQQVQAARFVDGRAPYLFWHVDLQGRQLLRLHEALMGDLGDLRVAGLWMPSIITLLRRRLLVLAVDGFDELAAEQGGSDALGALAVLVQQMRGRGTIVAASRRTFFDTDDYVSRSHLITRVASDCEFTEIRLQEWSADEATTYLARANVSGNTFTDPTGTYAAIEQELESPTHPMLTRPFLLTQIARGLLLYNMSPSEFIRGRTDPLRGVGEVIEAFVDREVTEKWKQQDTGEPFLDKEQHLRLLADVAEEMFRAQRSTIDVDVLEAITTLLLDEWNIDPGRRQQILQMVNMHVLLTPPSDDQYGMRSFDHEEFRDWFTAYALKDRLLRFNSDGSQVSHDLLSVAHLPDATAQYVCALIDRTPVVVADVVQGLVELVQREWRPTYLQGNCGTLVPFLLDGVESESRIVVDADVVYSSVVHEHKTLSNVTLRRSAFVNASLAGVTWQDVTLAECDLGELVVDRQATFRGVRFESCRIDGIRLVGPDGDETREYAPSRIRALLTGMGIECSDAGDPPDTVESLPDGDCRKLVRRVLNVFRRTTLLPESVVERRFRGEANRVIGDVLPLMERYQLLEERPWKGSGRQRAWGLASRLEDIERADGDETHSLHPFWTEVDALDARVRQ